MKTSGKDKDYRKALYKNLTQALANHGRIKTTLVKAKKIKSAFLKKYQGVVSFSRVGRRKGDGTEMVIIEWTGKKEDKKKNENVLHQKRTNQKKVASS